MSDNKVALKTAYGRYVSVNSAGELIGRSEAVGPRETWDPVFEEVCGVWVCEEVHVFDEGRVL